MPLSHLSSQKPIRLQLSRDLTRIIKRGHAWVYREALRELPEAAPGSSVILLDNRGGNEIARGYYDPKSSIALRICSTNRHEVLNDHWAETKMSLAHDLRQAIFDETTTGYRLINGEGDGLPGLVCDIYSRCAVIQFDGRAAENFWDAQRISEWLNETMGIENVFLKRKNRKDTKTEIIFGESPILPITFLENGLRFTANVVAGQKTGFFFDQRDNRARIKPLSSGKDVLNAFGYTGGFSVYAGLGGARHVTTVDLASPALESAKNHWRLNNLPPEKHETKTANVFDFLDSAVKENQRWDVIILDPPSFAPSESSIPQAIKAYEKLVMLGAKTTRSNGFLAVSSCSSHVNQAQYIQTGEEGISKARRKGKVIGIFGLPADHPTPLVMPELRYLKFLLLHLN